MCGASYFNRFKGFPLNEQAFLVHLRCDLSATSATVTPRATSITAAGAAATKTAAGRAASAWGCARWARATDQAGFEGFLAVFFALTLLGIAVCTDVTHGGLHWVWLWCALGSFAATATLGTYQALGAAATLFWRTGCGWTWANAVAAATAAGAFGAVVV